MTDVFRVKTPKAADFFHSPVVAGIFFKEIVPVLAYSVLEQVKLGIVSANIYYAGFGPAAANEFRKMLGPPTVNRKEMEQAKLD